jgi:hypothetical protein
VAGQHYVIPLIVFNYFFSEFTGIYSFALAVGFYFAMQGEKLLDVYPLLPVVYALCISVQPITKHIHWFTKGKMDFIGLGKELPGKGQDIPDFKSLSG